MDCSFTAYYVSTVPGQQPEAFSGMGQSWSKVMRQETEEACSIFDCSTVCVEQEGWSAFLSILASSPVNSDQNVSDGRPDLACTGRVSGQDPPGWRLT